MSNGSPHFRWLLIIPPVHRRHREGGYSRLRVRQLPDVQAPLIAVFAKNILFIRVVRVIRMLKITSQFVPVPGGGLVCNFNLGPRTLLSANLSYFHDHCLTQVLLPTSVAVSDGDGIKTHSGGQECPRSQALPSNTES